MQIKKIHLPAIKFNPNILYYFGICVLLFFCFCASLNLYYKYQEVKKLDEKIKRYSENIIVDEVNKDKFSQILNYLTVPTSTAEAQLNLPNPFLPKPPEEIISTSTPTKLQP